MSEVSREEIKTLLTELKDDMSTGFSNVNQRLDLINGKVQTNTVNIGRHDERLRLIEISPTKDIITLAALRWYIACVAGGGGAVLALMRILGRV